MPTKISALTGYDGDQLDGSETLPMVEDDEGKTEGITVSQLFRNPPKLRLRDDNPLALGTGDDYFFEYESANTRLRLRSADIDGGGTTGDLLHIEDGEQRVRFPGGVNIGSNWKINSVQSPTGTDRLNIQAVGINDPGELFVQARGTSDVARIAVSPDESGTNFSSLTHESDGTNHIIASESEGTASTLPLVLRMDTDDVITLGTSNSVTFNQITGTPTMAGHDHSAGGMAAVSGIATDAVGNAELDNADAFTLDNALNFSNAGDGIANGQSVSIADDSFTTITPHVAQGWLRLNYISGTGANATEVNALAYIDADNSNVGPTLDGSKTDVTDTSLTGTTGTDGNVTVGVKSDGTIDIENRTNASITVKVSTNQ